MKLLLSFAVGAILGDIFFHLIPESYHSYLVGCQDSSEVAYRKVGLSIIAGIFMFIIVEMILVKWSHPSKEESDVLLEIEKNHIIGRTIEHLESIDDQIQIFNHNDLTKTLESIVNHDKPTKIMENNNSIMTNLNALHKNYPIDHSIDFIDNNNSTGLIEQQLKVRRKREKQKENHLIVQSCEDTTQTNFENKSIKSNIDSGCQIIDTAGYLSLIANGFDNFTHGLAIGASFLVGPKVGLLTTFVIFIHEIPHEICDYAILVNSGFSRWDAVKAQSSVSLFGILGTALALYVKSVQILNAKTIWILPFSAGGFLYISLVNILPEILDRTSSTHNSLGQVACVILGIVFMAAVAII